VAEPGSDRVDVDARLQQVSLADEYSLIVGIENSLAGILA